MLQLLLYIFFRVLFRNKSAFSRFHFISWGGPLSTQDTSQNFGYHGDHEIIPMITWYPNEISMNKFHPKNPPPKIPSKFINCFLRSLSGPTDVVEADGWRFDVIGSSDGFFQLNRGKGEWNSCSFSCEFTKMDMNSETGWTSFLM